MKICCQILLISSLFFVSNCNDSSNQSIEPSYEQVGDSKGSTSKSDQAAEQSVEECQLMMGWEQWEPYHYREVGGSDAVKGLDIELMSMISEEIDCNISFVNGQWKHLLRQLNAGEIDFLTGASITEKRKQYAFFSDGYRTESFRLFIRSGELNKFPEYNITSLLQDGFRLGITMGYVYNDEITTFQENHSFEQNITSVSNGLINVSKLLESEIDGYLEDTMVGSSSIRRQGLENQIELHPYTINTGDVYLMFSRRSVTQELVNKFNHALARIRSDGRHQSLMDKYTH